VRPPDARTWRLLAPTLTREIGHTAQSLLLPFQKSHLEMLFKNNNEKFKPPIFKPRNLFEVVFV